MKEGQGYRRSTQLERFIAATLLYIDHFLISWLVCLEEYDYIELGMILSVVKLDSDNGKRNTNNQKTRSI